jgi:hypothetical protein
VSQENGTNFPTSFLYRTKRGFAILSVGWEYQKLNCKRRGIILKSSGVATIWQIVRKLKNQPVTEENLLF